MSEPENNKKDNTDGTTPKAKTRWQKVKDHYFDGILAILVIVPIYATPAIKALGIVKGALLSTGIMAAGLVAAIPSAFIGRYVGNYTGWGASKIVDLFKGKNKERTSNIKGTSALMGSFLGAVTGGLLAIDALNDKVTETYTNDTQKTVTQVRQATPAIDLTSLSVKPDAQKAFAYPSQADALKVNAPKLAAKPMMRLG